MVIVCSEYSLQIQPETSSLEEEVVLLPKIGTSFVAQQDPPTTQEDTHEGTTPPQPQSVQPVGARLQHFAEGWENITSDKYILRIIRKEFL